MSYELWTPLTSIAGFAEMLAGGYAGELGGTADEYVNAIMEAVARLSVLIDDVLDLTQSDSGSLLLPEEQDDLETLCAESAEVTREGAGWKNIEFVLGLSPSGGVRMWLERRPHQALKKISKNKQDAEEGRGVSNSV